MPIITDSSKLPEDANKQSGIWTSNTGGVFTRVGVEYYGRGEPYFSRYTGDGWTTVLRWTHFDPLPRCLL